MIRSWTFQKKVTAGFAVMVGLSAVTSAIAVYALRTAVASKDRVVAINSVNLINGAKLQAASNEYTAAFRGYLLTGEASFLNQRRQAAEAFEETFRRLDQGVYTSEGHRRLSDIQKAQAELAVVQERIILLRKTKNGVEAATHAVEQEALPKRERITATIKAFVEREQNLLDEAGRDSSARASLASTLLVSLAVATVLFAGVTALLLGRVLSRQIGSAVQHVQSSSAELQSSA